MSDKIRVLVVEPMKPCEVREVSGLNDMQAIVGGHIEAVYPLLWSATRWARIWICPITAL